MKWVIIIGIVAVIVVIAYRPPSLVTQSAPGAPPPVIPGGTGGPLSEARSGRGHF